MRPPLRKGLMTAALCVTLCQAPAASANGIVDKLTGGTQATPTTTGGGGLLGSLLGGGKAGVKASGKGMNAQMNIDKAKDQAAANQEALNPPDDSTPIVFPGSVADIINSPISDENGKSVGLVYDILVDRKSGLASTVIVNDRQTYRGIDLAAVKFNDVSIQPTQGGTGNTAVSSTGAAVARGQSFDYAHLPTDRYVSLRALEGGHVLDDKGQEAGRIDAVMYRNNSVQNIVFSVPAVDKKHAPTTFVIPYQRVKIITEKDRHDIQLNSVQTAALATNVFQNAAK